MSMSRAYQPADNTQDMKPNHFFNPIKKLKTPRTDSYSIAQSSLLSSGLSTPKLQLSKKVADVPPSLYGSISQSQTPSSGGKSVVLNLPSLNSHILQRKSIRSERPVVQIIDKIEGPTTVPASSRIIGKGQLDSLPNLRLQVPKVQDRFLLQPKVNRKLAPASGRSSADRQDSKSTTDEPHQPQHNYYDLESLAKLPEEERVESVLFKHITDSHKVLHRLSNDKLAEKPVVGFPDFARSKRLILALDLDETLVHCCNFDSAQDQTRTEHKLTYQNEKGSMVVARVTTRPHYKKFLAEASKHFDLVVFTASEREYAVSVVDLLDPNREYIKAIYSRKHCVRTDKGFMVKDLRIICGDDLSKILLIDNSSQCFAPQISNGIPIIPYYYDNQDTELLELLKFLSILSTHEHPVKTVKEYFSLHKYTKFASASHLLEEINSGKFRTKH